MKFLHVGLAVKDLERTSSLWAELFGIRWEPIKEHALDGGTFQGEPGGPFRSLVTHGLTNDDVEIEMIQPLEGRFPDTLVLDGREGFSHIAFTVDDLDEAGARLVARGLRPVADFRAETYGYTFYEGDELGGPLVQLVWFGFDRTLNLPPED